MTTLGTVINKGLHSARPAAGTAGSLFYETDTTTLFRDNGASWDSVASNAAAGLADQGVFTYLDGTVGSAPSTPASGKLRLYAKTGKVLAVKDDSGTETVFGASSSGGIPLGITRYANGSDGATYTSSNAAMTDIDATNAIVTFTAPASGKILVQLSVIISANGNDTCYIGIRESSSTLGTSAVYSNDQGHIIRVQASWYLTGVSAGSHTYKAAWKVGSVNTMTIYTGPNNGSVELTVWEAP